MWIWDEHYIITQRAQLVCCLIAFSWPPLLSSLSGLAHATSAMPTPRLRTRCPMRSEQLLRQLRELTYDLHAAEQRNHQADNIFKFKLCYATYRELGGPFCYSGR